VHKWSAAASVVKSVYELPPGPFYDRTDITVLSKTFIATESIDESKFAFLRIPPLTTRKVVEGWSVLPFPFEPYGFTTYTPENLLAVAEHRDG
jgi:hypothetical protein